VSQLHKSLDDDLLRHVAETAAVGLEEFCASRQLRFANERDHMAPCCADAVARITGVLEVAPYLGGHAYGLKHGWRGLGHVDVVLRWAHRPATFLELKCGARSDALAACVWDAVKLGTAVLGGNAGAGYLLAGAPASRWTGRAAGAELFETAEWVTLGPDVRDAYLPYWRFWEAEGGIPGRIPNGLVTTTLGSYPFTIGDTPWELRLARVSPQGDWIDWPPTTDEQERVPRIPEVLERLVGDATDFRRVTIQAEWTEAMRAVADNETISLQGRMQIVSELADAAARELGVKVFLPARQFLHTLAMRIGVVPPGARLLVSDPREPSQDG
jgi:hypothetical protein